MSTSIVALLPRGEELIINPDSFVELTYDGKKVSEARKGWPSGFIKSFLDGGVWRMITYLF